MADSREIIAANLLADRTCENCLYNGGGFCKNPKHHMYKGYNNQPLPEDNTCQRWKERNAYFFGNRRIK